MDFLEDAKGDSQTEFINNDADHFDTVIGHIEDMLINTKFTDTLSKFMEQYWKYFDESEENKLIYMDIYTKYTHLIEQYIEEHLKSKYPDFSITKFVLQLQSRKLDGEVYDILYTLSDFMSFKESMLDYKNMKEGRVADLSCGIKVTKIS